MKQDYSNHKRYYIPHHFVFYPLITVLLGFSLYFGCTRNDGPIWHFMSALLLLVGWLSFMLRQHYAMTLQNRLVLQELRYRYFVLTGKRFEALEAHLSGSQRFALRFASDEELPALVDRALNEQLSADAIKRAIQDWKADYRRV